MSQDYQIIEETDTLKNSRQVILDRDNASTTNFSGPTAPSGSHVTPGILWYDTAENKLFVLKVLSPLEWQRIPMISAVDGALQESEGGTGANNFAQARINMDLNFVTAKEGVIDVLSWEAGGTGAFTKVGARSNLGIVLDVSQTLLPATAGGTGFDSLAGLAGVTGLNLGSLATAQDGIPTTTKVWGYTAVDAANKLGFRGVIGCGTASTLDFGNAPGNAIVLVGSGVGSIPSDIMSASIAGMGIGTFAYQNIWSGTADPTGSTPAGSKSGDVYFQY